MERIEITDPVHISMLWRWLGLMDAAELAAKKAKQTGVVGMGICADLIQAQASEYGTQVKIKNVILAMQNGLDPKRENLLLDFVDGRPFLCARPLDLVEQADNE